MHTSSSEATAPSKLRRLVDGKGLRYPWLADQLGISPSMLSRVLDGKRRMADEQAAKLAAVLGLPGPEFLPAESRDGAAA